MDALNTGVNIISSSLNMISYRRIWKWQARGFNFAMPDFVTVPFGGKVDVQKFFAK
jgi:hypothetical protein